MLVEFVRPLPRRKTRIYGCDALNTGRHGTHGYTIVVHGAAVLEPLLTVTSVCELLDVSRQTLYRLIQRGELVPIRVSRSPRFSADAAREYLRRCHEAAAP